MIYNFRTARAMATPIDWNTFCKRAHADANEAYAEQLIEQASREDLIVMVRELRKRLEGATFAARLNVETISAMRKRPRE